MKNIEGLKERIADPCSENGGVQKDFRENLSHNWEKLEAARAETETYEALLNFVWHG